MLVNTFRLLLNTYLEFELKEFTISQIRHVNDN